MGLFFSLFNFGFLGSLGLVMLGCGVSLDGVNVVSGGDLVGYLGLFMVEWGDEGFFIFDWG